MGWHYHDGRPRGQGMNRLAVSTYLGVELVKNILQIVAFDGLFRVEKIEELLHKLLRHVALELLHLDGFVDDELEEELVDALKMRPGRVHLLLLVNTRLREIQLVLVHARERAEDVFLNHLHRLVEVGNDGAHGDFLVTQHSL